MALSVSVLLPEDYPKWDAFVQTQESGSVFNTSLWLRDRAEGELNILLCHQHGEWLGGYAFLMNRRMGLRRIVQPKLTMYHSPVVADRLLRGVHTDQRNEVLEHLIRHLPTYDALSLTYPPAFSQEPYFHEGLFSHRVLRTNRIHPPLTEDALLGRYGRHTRRGLALAAKAGLRVCPLHDADEIHRLSAISLAHSGRGHPMTRSELACILSRFEGSGQVIMQFVKTPDDLVVAAAVMVCDSHAVYGVLLGIDRACSKSQCGLLLMHHCITRALEKKLVFDFTGSLIPGVDAFIRKFRPVPYQLHHFSRGRTLRARLLNTITTPLGHQLY
jgi:CelD/BcsL family acetyltransferase involved in cellulose biosynthesis